MANEPVRILIADDHRIFLEGLRSLLASFPWVEVVGEAVSGEEVVAQAAALQPDVILMDIGMPGLNGIEATRRIVAASPHIAILMITMFDDDESVFAAMRAGARGYLLKGADQAEFRRAVEAVANGEALFSPSIAVRLLRFFRGSQVSAAALPFPDLTEREYEVLELIARGLGNAEIARRLEIAGKTVRNHISNIFSKLQVADRAEAIARAREAGLGRE